MDMGRNDEQVNALLEESNRLLSLTQRAQMWREEKEYLWPGGCMGGPILVVYLDGVWYHPVDHEHLH